MGFEIKRTEAKAVALKRVAWTTPFIVCAMALLGFMTVSAESTTVKVSDINDPDGWNEWQRDAGDSSLSSEFGAPAGLGSSALKQVTPGGNDKTYVYTAANGLALSDLEAIGYYTYRADASTSPSFQVPAINLGVDFNGAAAGGFTTLVFEPVYQTGGAAAVLSGEWQNWDASGEAIWWSSNPIPGAPNRDTFVSLNSLVAANPDAVVLSYAINQGSGNAGLIGAADGLTINGTVYDFELKPVAPTSKDQCKNGGYKNFQTAYKNQGQCVAAVTANSNSRHN